MTEQQSRGVQVLSQLVKDLSRHDPERSRAVFDGLSDQETADVLSLHAAALALDADERDVFVESVAERLREVTQ
jgi:hypothetical protein